MNKGFTLNLMYKNIDDIVCSKCNGKIDDGLECLRCHHSMWDEVYPEYFIEYGNLLAIKFNRGIPA